MYSEAGSERARERERSQKLPLLPSIVCLRGIVCLSMTGGSLIGVVAAFNLRAIPASLFCFGLLLQHFISGLSQIHSPVLGCCKIVARAVSALLFCGCLRASSCPELVISSFILLAGSTHTLFALPVCPCRGWPMFSTSPSSHFLSAHAGANPSFWPFHGCGRGRTC